MSRIFFFFFLDQIYRKKLELEFKIILTLYSQSSLYIINIIISLE